MLKKVKTELFECQRYLESSVLDAFYTRIIDQILRIKDVEQSETHLCLDAEFEISGVDGEFFIAHVLLHRLLQRGRYA